MRITLFILFISLFSTLSAQNNDDEKVKVDDLLEETWNLSDSAEKLNKVLDALELSRKINYTKGIFKSYELLVLLHNGYGKYEDAIKHALLSLQVADTNPEENFRLGFVTTQLSYALEKIGAYSDAIKHRKQAIQYQLRDPAPDILPFAIYYSYNRLGAMCLQVEQYDSALIYFQNALQIGIEKKSLKHMADANNDIGLVYYKIGNIDSAMSRYTKALDYYDNKDSLTEKDDFMISLIRGNLADCLPNDDPRKETFFLEDIRGSEIYGNYSNVVSTLIHYSEYLTEKGAYLKAESMLQKAEATFNKYENLGVDLQIDLYSKQTAFYIRSGQKSKAKTSFEKLQALMKDTYGKKAREELLSVHSSYKLSKIQDELEIEVMRGEKKAAKIEALNKKNQLIRLRSISFLVIGLQLVVLLIVIIMKVRGDARKKAKEKDLENKLLQMQVEHKTDRLNRSVTGLKRKTEFVEELMDRINSIEMLDPAQRSSLKLFIYNELDMDKSVLENEDDVKVVGDEIISRLKLNYPSLTESDLRLLGYIKLKLTNKQIAQLKNISPESVKIAKNRLRKKLELPPGSDFIESLSL